MKKRALILISLFVIMSCLGTVRVFAEQLSLNNPPEISYSGSYRYVTRRYNTIKQIPNSILYNSGGAYGYLNLQSWSYEKDFSTGKMYYEAIYAGYVQTGSGPIQSMVIKK